MMSSASREEESRPGPVELQDLHLLLEAVHRDIAGHGFEQWSDA